MFGMSIVLDDGTPTVARWLAGDCHVLTLSLHRLTGWPIKSLHDGRVSGGHSPMHGSGFLVHSGLIRPDRAFVDARGATLPRGMATIEREYIVESETWARWLRTDNGEFTADDLVDVVPGDRDAFEASMVDAASFTNEHLLVHLAGYPFSPLPDAGRWHESKGDLDSRACNDADGTGILDSTPF